MPALLPALKRHFGHDSFRPGQEEVVRSILSGRPTVAVLPTGAGKSLCFQLPALLCEGTAVVISPLIALMKDQVDALRQRGIPAAKITSAETPEEKSAVFTAFRQGQLKLLYIAPERLAQPGFRELLQQVPLSLLAVDEAHCVSQWGHDFRPDYLAIHEVVRQITPPRIAALTATATPEVQDEMGVALGMQSPAVFVRGFHRPDLRLDVIRTRGEADRLEQLEELVKDRPEGRAVLAYASTRKQTEAAAEHLRACGFVAKHYHAGCEAGYRTQIQDEFLQDKLDVLIATNAFGMGIDKPDIRLLIHLALPTSVESYYQEVGRAGRDGLGGRAVLLHQAKDARTAEFLLTEGNPNQEQPPHVMAALRKLSRLISFANGSTCRHRSVLEYFGDPDAVRLLQGCNQCDRCSDDTFEQRRELTDDEHTTVRMALSGVARAHGQYGRGRVAAMLVGANTEEIRRSGLNRLSTHGLLKDYGRVFVLELLDSLEESGLICTTGTQYPLLEITSDGADLMHDRLRQALRWPGEGKDLTGRNRRTSPVSSPDCDGFDEEIFRILAKWRRELAQGMKKPPYTVFADRTLKLIAKHKPHSLEEMAQIHGIGPAKLEKYGDAVLKLLGAPSARA
jgi:ATP-dependent DNA helicase RecQ